MEMQKRMTAGIPMKRTGPVWLEESLLLRSRGGDVRKWASLLWRGWERTKVPHGAMVSCFLGVVGKMSEDVMADWKKKILEILGTRDAQRLIYGVGLKRQADGDDRIEENGSR
jgi:hypothetical protein